MSRVLAIDPGREKCGMAAVSANGVLHKEIVARETVSNRVLELCHLHSVEVILLGNGTSGKQLLEELRAAGIPVPVRIVEEAFSTLRARKRFFQENPPRGIRRLLPQGLLSPNRPYDDYVAVILAEDYLDKLSTV